MLLSRVQQTARTLPLHAPTPAHPIAAQTRRQRRVPSSQAPTAAATAAATRPGAPTAGRQTVCRSANRDQQVKPMEVEIKLRLPDKSAYDKVAALLASSKKASYAQENYFFDGDNKQLEATLTVLRLRFFNGNEKAAITIKGKQVLDQGIGRASEVEEDVPDAAAARQWLQDPSKMLDASPLVRQLREKLGVQSLVSLGGFGNQRDVYNWEGETLELDQTNYEWGTMYEIEVETTNPDSLRPKLESFLTSNGIQHSYSKSSKFGNFRNRTLV